MFLLNIGLMTSDNQPVSLPWLRSALTLAKVIVRRSAVLQSSTEPTFVAELGAPLNFTQLEQLARDLKQDCIAYYNGAAHDTDAGILAGPKPWGEFDADQFLLPSGGFLGDALRLARMNDAQFQEALSMPRSRPVFGTAPCASWRLLSRAAMAQVFMGHGFGELNGAEAEQMVAAYRAAHPEVVKVWQDQGHYIGLDRPAWDQPLEHGDTL